jgi:Zn-finger domain-containing protein
MMRPSPEVIRQTADIAKRYAEFIAYIAAWRTSELERLPQAIANAAVAQGRCQVLGELAEFLAKAPTYDQPKPGIQPGRQTQRTPEGAF